VAAAPAPRRRRRRALRALAILGIVALVLGSAVVVVARVRFHGAPLARLISDLINEGIRGQVTMGSVEWPIASLPAFVTGGWIPVTMRDVQVYDDGSSAAGVADPSQRKLLLRVELAEGEIDAHALAFGHPDFVVKNLRIPRGGWVLIEEVAQTGPGDEDGAKVISLLGAFRGKQSSGVGAGKSVGASSIFDLRDFSFEGVTVEVSFRDYDLLLEGARGSGFLYGDFTDALAERLYFSLAPTIDRGRLDIKVYLDGKVTPGLIYDVPLHGIQVHRLAQLPTEWPRHGLAHDLHWDITAHSENGAEIHTRGAMLGYFDSDNGGTFDLMLWARDAGSIVHRFSEGLFGGSDLNAQARVSGPMYGPRVALQVGNVEVWVELAKDAPPLEVRVPVASAWLDYATESGGVPEAMAESAGGKVAASVQLSLGPFWFDLALDVREPIYIEPHLPRALAAELMASAGAVGKPHLSGRFHVVGDGKRFGYQQLDIMLGRIHLTGDIVHDETGKMHFPELHSDVGATRVTTRGTLNLPDGAMDMGMRVRSDDLARWLRYFEAPEGAARTMEGSARVQGTLDEPRACAALRWSGVPMVDDVMSWLSYAGEQLTVDLNRRPAQPTPCVRLGSLAQGSSGSGAQPGDPSAGQSAGRAAGALGGSLWASGRLHLGERPRVVSFVAQGNELDLGKIPLVGEIISGRMALSASTSGGFDRLDTHVRASVDGLTIAGDAYRLLTPCASSAAQPPGTGAGELCLHVRPDGGQELELALAREGGGQLEVRAGIDDQDGLDGRIAVIALPIDNLAVLDYAGGFPIGGVVTAAMQLGGTLAAPLVTGNIDWNDSWYERAFLGHTGIRIAAPDAETLRITGSLLQGDVVVTADVSNQPPYDASIDLSLRRVELDRLMPELTALLLSPELQAEGIRARAWLTGDIHMEMPLLAAATTQPQVQARLTEAEVIVDYRDARGQPVPLRLRNDRATPIAIRFDGTRASLLEPVTLVGPDGARFTVEHGRVTLAPQPRNSGDSGGDAGISAIGAIDVQIAGDLDMRLFEPYVSDLVSSVSGKVGVRATVSGPLEDPQVDVELQIKDTVAVRPSGQEAVVSLQQGGRITIDNDQLVLTGTEIRVADALTGQEVALDILGGIRLEDFEPVEWTLHMDGQLAGQMLLLAAPELFSRASGTADLSVSIRGPSDAPRVDANMIFNGQQPLALTLRGLGREVRLESGELELSDDVVEINDLAGQIGDNGRITRASGVVGLVDWEIADMDISVNADSLPLRIPNEFELTANVADLRIVGDVSSGLELDGVVEVVDGRYFRRFNLISDVLSIDRGGGGGESQPLFADLPLLASADLDLLVDVRSFSVQNNLAAIHMSGDIMVTGTPSAPRFDGEIQVSDGEFKLPGARARFTRTWGAVTFSPSRSFPTQTPTVSLQSEGDYRDAGGQYHLITFTVSGSWSRAEWDLYTSSGLNKGQTFALLFSGRTPTELRKSLGDEAPGVDSGRLESAINTSDNAADQILKDVAGDFISLLVEDTLRNITNLDVARIEIGTGSIGFHGEKEITEKIRLTGDLEQTGTGRTIDVRGEMQLSDRVSVEGGARSQVYSDPAEEDLTDYRFRAVYRRYFLWPW
jgi:TamB, inner membrane protein subunit of TAM complex